jgi:hypothetical protein
MDKMAQTPGATPPPAAPTVEIIQDKLPQYSVSASDGAAVGVLARQNSAVVQIMFFYDEIDASSHPIQTQQTLQHLTKIRRMFYSSVRMAPDSALQLAVGILQNLGSMSPELKRLFNIPEGIEIHREPRQ